MGMLIRRHRGAAADIDTEQSEAMNTENVDVQADEDAQATQVNATKKASKKKVQADE